VRKLLPRHRLGRAGGAAIAVVLTGALTALAVTPAAGAPDVETLEARVADARGEAEQLAAELQANAEALIEAQSRAAVAAAREAELTELLTVGQQRADELARGVEHAKVRLDEERARLRRARVALAERLVQIYFAGIPSTADLLLGSSDFDQLLTRSDYLKEIEDADSDLAARVEQVRNAVKVQLGIVRRLKAQVDAYNERISAARDEISAVRAAADAEAAALADANAARQASLGELQSQMSGWIDDIQAAEQASEEAAQAEVGEWLGGDGNWAIPEYIVMCESGGNYEALNASSGAGGAYQIIPSTWEAYGGEGDPQNAPPAEQDAIAAQIWADSGPGAWVCAG
jgi:septal ring factor EnvC (AmiA/AmiB activator)